MPDNYLGEFGNLVDDIVTEGIKFVGDNFVGDNFMPDKSVGDNFMSNILWVITSWL